MPREYSLNSLLHPRRHHGEKLHQIPRDELVDEELGLLALFAVWILGGVIPPRRGHEVPIYLSQVGGVSVERGVARGRMPVREDEVQAGLRDALELEDQVHQFALALVVGRHRSTVYRVHHGRAVAEVERDVVVEVPAWPAGDPLSSPTILDVLVGDADLLRLALVVAREPV